MCVCARARSSQYYYCTQLGSDHSVCVLCVVIPFVLDVRLVNVPAGVTQGKRHTGFVIHLPSAVLALILLSRRTPPFLSLVDREVESCVLTN